MNLSLKSNLKLISVGTKTILISSVLISCATYDLQKGKNLAEISNRTSFPEVDFKLFLVGDAGNADEPQAKNTLNFIKSKLDSADENSVLLFLGDNIYPLGMPSEDSKDYPLAKEKLENQLAITQNFKGKTYVIPGNHDWYHGVKGLKAQEKFVKEYLNDKKAFLPRDGKPIDDISLTKDIKLIVVDSEWALINWNKYDGINKNSDFKTREDFYTEFKDLIIKNQDKKIIVAIHHPVISSGTHAGFNSAKSNLSALKGKLPIPGIATLFNKLRSSSGASMEDISNNHYSELANRIKSIIQDKENVILVSGHDHNLQYHQEKNIKQIISGAGSKTDPATVANKTDFSFGGNGFAVLTLRKDHSSDVEFFSTKNNSFKKLTHIEVQPKPESFVNNYPTQFPAKVTSTVYPIEATQKSKFYTWLWGDHYRKYFGMPIEAETTNLATLNGGFKAFREGGGNQSNSLRLKAPDGQEFVMRGIKKSAVRFLNNQAFKKNTLGEELYNTFPERFLLDFYTTSHPFTPFSVPNLADKIGIFHSNPKLYYIPKQYTLEKYNKNFGDEMYMIEERFSADPKTLASLGGAKDLINTTDVLKNLRKNNTYSIDQEMYIKARLFDMLIGDWDRHDDQWKWAEYVEGNQTVYKPIPKDRDQAFSKYDGAAFKFIMNVPVIRHMKTFKDDIKNVKWFNMEPYPQDLIFLKNTTQEDWLAGARYIQQNLTAADIDAAFDNLPKEVQDETITDIKEKLKIRKTKLENYAQKYFEVLQEKVPLAGTVNKDRFVITKNNNEVEVKQYQVNKDSTEELVFQKTYKDSQTKELWIYGLEDDDLYEVSGKGKSKITIRLIGGDNHDTYNVAKESGSRVKIYDFKNQNNTYNAPSATQNISNDYDVNTYNWKHPKYNFFAGFPNANYNPDDGVILGFVANYTVNNFLRNPFTQKHSLKANLYTATGGFNVGYKGVFKKAISSWDAEIDASYSTPYFSRTFFGLSNESLYDKETVEKDYNRVRISEFKVAPSISKTSWLNLRHQFQLTYEHSKVQRNEDRFIAVSKDINPDVFDGQQFGGANYEFSFRNVDNNAFPTLGLELSVNAGWKTNLSHFAQNFITYKGNIDVYHRIDKRGKFVFANSANAMIINNNHFEIYQAASIGGRNGFKAYRNERFSGKSYFMNNAEIRWDFGRIKNNIVPTNMGILVGYDLGRVWNDNEYSQKWHQAVGAGFWINIVETFSARANYFIGEDGGRISAGFGLQF